MPALPTCGRKSRSTATPRTCWPPPNLFEQPNRLERKAARGAFVQVFVNVAEAFTEGIKISAAVCRLLTISGASFALGQPFIAMAGTGGSVNVAVDGVFVAAGDSCATPRAGQRP